MKKQHIGAMLIGLAVVSLATLALVVVPTRIDAKSGTIHFPFYRGTPAMDAARDMIFALGWKHKSEGGNGRGVTLQAVDGKGKEVTFQFTYRLLNTSVLITTEGDAQYSVEDVTKELARRIAGK